MRRVLRFRIRFVVSDALCLFLGLGDIFFTFYGRNRVFFDVFRVLGELMRVRGELFLGNLGKNKIEF